MPEPILRSERLTYSYPGAGRPALSELSVELGRGDLCVVCGESGSGKSTLLRAACGLVPHFHGGEASGGLWVAGMSVREHGPGDLAPHCGTLLQDPETQVVMSGVRAEIALPLENRGEPPAAVARAVEEVALALGIGGLLGRRAESLSGGELQRVALAAALAARPPLLLLDEPTSQLDPVAGDELISLLRRLNEDWGTTVVIAEHRLERCLPAADRVIALDQGRLACDAPPHEFLGWATERAPSLLPPAARLFALAGLTPLPASVKEARAALDRASLVPAAALEPEAVDHRPRPFLTGTALPSQSDRGRSAAFSIDSERDTSDAWKTRSAPGDLEHASAGVAAGAGGRNATHGDARAPLRERARRWRSRRSEKRASSSSSAALAFRAVWHELPDGPAILRGIDLELRAGERAALMGRNGAGKSTLLRHARGLLAPTRGLVERGGPVVLLLQSPGDYLIHDRCRDEVGDEGLVAAGLADRAASDPLDLSGGERQRLALEVVLGGPEPPAVACLDEPTRGMDPARKRSLAARLDRLADTGCAVVVATHDTGFAAEVADRVVLMGEGEVIADGPAGEVLAGGWHFATETARVLGGASGALTPEHGARLLEKELVG